MAAEKYASAKGTADVFGGLAWLVLVFAIHLIDVFTRYRTGAVQFYIWTLFFVIYAIIALRFYRLWGDRWVIIGCYFLTAFLFPYLYPRLLPYLGGSLAAMIVTFNPVWVIYLLFWHSEYYPKISFAYMVFWIALLTFSFMPQVQTYAQDQGYTTAMYSPAIAVRYMVSTSVKAWYALSEAITGIQQEVAKETKRTYKTITGDYYTGEVDKSKEKPLGVSLAALKPAQSTFEEGRKSIVYTRLNAETIAEPLDIRVSCTADNIPANSIKPKSEFRVETSEKGTAIDCEFDDLKAKNYNFKATADFTFTTRSYQLVYTMDKERLREERRALEGGVPGAEDPLADFADKNPKTQYTPGPVMVGLGEDIGLDKQPLGILATDTRGPTIGITIDNIWTGKLKKIDYILLITPKGIEVEEVNGIPAVPIEECSLLPIEEDRIRCDDTVDNLYYVPQDEIDRINREKDIIAYTFRVYTKVSDYSKLVGADPLPKYFKVTARYDYTYVTTKSITVEKSKTPAKPAEETKPPEP